MHAGNRAEEPSTLAFYAAGSEPAREAEAQPEPDSEAGPELEAVSAAALPEVLAALPARLGPEFAPLPGVAAGLPAGTLWRAGARCSLRSTI